MFILSKHKLALLIVALFFLGAGAFLGLQLRPNNQEFIVVTDAKILSEDGKKVFVSTVKNVTKTLVFKNVKAEIQFFDDSANPVTRSSASIDVLNPNQEWQIRLPIMKESSTEFRMRIDYPESEEINYGQ